MKESENFFMIDFAMQLYRDLVEKLDAADIAGSEQKFSLKDRLDWIIQSIDQLKEKLRSHVFSEEDEIQFFKMALPQFLSELIYYTEKAELDWAREHKNKGFRLQILERRLRRIEDYYIDHMEFFKYCRSGMTHLDSHYFVRNHANRTAHNDLLASVIDTGFCTTYTVKRATLLAYSRLEEDIHELRQPENDNNNLAAKNKLVWTETKIALTELIYSFHQKGVFNKGNADLMTIAVYISNAFSVPLGNVTRTFQDILSRKTGNTLFLDSLKIALNQRIDDIEERHRR
jgi:hypothetical protein